VAEPVEPEKLMLRLRNGDEFALNDLVERFHLPLVNYFRRFGVYSDEEDLVQEVFVRLYRNRKRYQVKAKFTTYLYTIARSVWIDRIRRETRRRQLLDTAREDPVFPGPKAIKANDPESAEQARLLAGNVARLPRKLRDVMMRSIYEEKTYEVIAAELAIPVGTVKSRVHLATRKLKKQLRPGATT